VETKQILFAFGLTLLAGLSTGIGSTIAFFTRKTNTRFLSVSLGFSAGVMIYVSLTEIMTHAKEGLNAAFGPEAGPWAAVGAFFAGIALSAVIDNFVPVFENPHEIRNVEDMELEKRGKLMRMGMFSALALAIHNFPEGLATFVSALNNPQIGISIAIAIAIHNIPEGISVSVPIYYATGSRRKAFTYSFLSGLCEPLGALVGFLVLMPFLSDALFGALFGLVAGIMVFISFDELLPAAHEYGEHHLAVYGLIAGMAVMAVSLLLTGHAH